MRIQEIQQYQSPHTSESKKEESKERLKRLIRERAASLEASQTERDRFSADRFDAGTVVMGLHESRHPSRGTIETLYAQFPGELVDEVLAEK